MSNNSSALKTNDSVTSNSSKPPTIVEIEHPNFAFTMRTSGSFRMEIKDDCVCVDLCKDNEGQLVHIQIEDKVVLVDDHQKVAGRREKSKRNGEENNSGAPDNKRQTPRTRSTAVVPTAEPNTNLLKRWNDFANIEIGSSFCDIYVKWSGFYKRDDCPEVLAKLLDTFCAKEDINTFEQWNKMKKMIFKTPGKIFKVDGTENDLDEQEIQVLTLTHALLKIINIYWPLCFQKQANSGRKEAIDGYKNYEKDLNTLAKISDQVRKMENLLTKYKGQEEKWEYDDYY